MTTKTFFEFYDLTDTEVYKIFSKKEGLAIILHTHLSMKFIANGFRSEFDDYFYHEFIFKGVSLDISLEEPIDIIDYKYLDEKLSFKANEKLITIPEVEVIVHKNCNNK